MRALRFLAPLALVFACSSDETGSPTLGGVAGSGGTGGSASQGGSSVSTGGAGGAGAGSGGGQVAGTAGAQTAAGAAGGSAGGAAGAAGGAAGTGGGPKYPLTITPLTAAQTSTANMSLFFSLTDANGDPVTDFDGDDFEVREDDQPLAKNESDFQAAPLTGQTLDIPTVILLDLSASIVVGGNLQSIKDAAVKIVEAALPEQSLALVSFADGINVRVSFTKDKKALLSAIALISDKDGLSTNLYGAVSEALGMWNDGFVGAGSTGRLTSGFVLALTDGADTAGVKTVEQVIAQRGSKRIITVGISDDVNTEALQKLGNAGFIKTASFATLANDVGKINAASQALGKSVYRASYCSPKLAGQHELLFYPKGNPIPTAGAASCVSAAVTPTASCETLGNVPCGVLPGESKGSCCPPNAPYVCGASKGCYSTPEAAAEACGSTKCVACHPYQEGGSSTLSPGPFLEVPFKADGHSTKQCPAAWGANCKALAACCAGLPASAAQSCSDKVVSLLGDEAQCTQSKQQSCPSFTGECATYKACCDSLSNEVQRTNCLDNATSYASTSNQAACKSATQASCPASGAGGAGGSGSGGSSAGTGGAAGAPGGRLCTRPTDCITPQERAVECEASFSIKASSAKNEPCPDLISYCCPS